MLSIIYLDNNGTSPPTKEHLTQLFAKIETCAGNPSSPHVLGRAASVALTQARRSVAKALNLDASQIIFLSGASEANNFIISNISKQSTINGNGIPHVLTSNIEHPAVLEPLENLEKQK